MTTQPKTKIRYDYKFLQQFCNDNNINITKNYSLEKVNRNTIIEANCLIKGCVDICSKGVVSIVKYGCFCKKHTKENGIKKAKATCLINLGVEHPAQSLKVKEKMKATCLKNLGFEFSQQNLQVREKTKATWLINYGVEHPSQSQIIKEKIKANNLMNYGFENPQQNAEVSEKASKNAYKSYDYIFPSGRIERIQGYEKYGLDDLLLKEHILEDDIVTKRSEVPVVWYEDINGKKRRYFVDFFIKSQNRCIEVKSIWTANKKKDCIYLKQQALKDAGYKCEIWIYDGNKNLVNKIL
jgi:hypothetical protein